MRALFTLLLASSILAGCTTPLPRCDGTNYRPVNPDKQTSVLKEKPWWEQEPYATQYQ